MARKYDFISELYNRTCKTVVATPASWEAFLRSACYNYRLRFDEQLLVHAQRPDATAVLQIDDWNQKFGRWVNRGAHGIAVFEDAAQRRQRLVHYFDISDTHPSRFSRRVPIWQMRDEYTAEVIDTLESTFGELNDKETLAVAIESAARNAVEDNIPDYLPDLLYSVKDSFLDGVSEEEITHIFKTAVRNSVAYMTMTRLGIEAGEYFEPDDLRDVVNFTTPATLNALGYATSDIAEMGLAEISRTILALDRQNRIIAEKTKADYNVGKEKTERSPDDERDHLHDAGGLSAPRSDNAGAAGAVDGQVRPDAEEVPEGASQGTLLQPADELRPERASERHGAQSERDGTDADGADGSVGGRDGESESDGYDELGSEDEQYLAELLKDKNNSLWAAVLYGIRYSDDQIVTVALSQVGNVGGEPYWSWYGFGSRVEWCACFVSWCADQCGYIDTGVVPKYAGCVNGVQWFKDRGQWIDGSAEPVPGMIIFFDWDNKGSSGPQDGQSDHTGIVQKVENGIVYTVEGNSGDSCRVNQYSVGHYEILGYGVPQY